MQTPGPDTDPSLPVLVGVGTSTSPAPVTDIMEAAARSAADDAGQAALLSRVDRILLPQGSWSLTDPARTVARRIGSPAARTARFEIGVSQQEVIHDALSSIARGDASVVLVVGAEARAFERANGTPADTETQPPDATFTRPPDFVAATELAAGIVWPPVQQYALIENALASEEGTDPVAHRSEVAALWAGFNEVARHNPEAAFPAPRTADDIATPAARNRPLAHPYNLWHSSQWTVDQGAALLFCAAGTARTLGVPTDRWVFAHVGLHSSQAVTLTARRALHAWPAMQVLGHAASTHLGQPLDSLALTDLYSCFPAAVRVQQRALGLDVKLTPTITGGMAFAGGPFNNYVLQSTAAMARRLRDAPAELGLVTTVSGMLTKPGLAVWAAHPPAADRGPLVADLAAEASSATGTVAVADPEEAGGKATVTSFTVTYDPDDPLRPARTAIVADLADGSRLAATCEDAAVAAAAIGQSLIGQAVHIARTTFTL